MAAEEETQQVTDKIETGFSGLKPSFMNFLGNINNSLDSIMDNNVFRTIIIIFLVFYAAVAAPNLPPGIKSLLRDKTGGTIVRIVFAFVIVLLAGNVKTLSLALLIAIGLVITLQNLEDKAPDVTLDEESNGATWIKEDGIDENNVTEDNKDNLEEVENFNGYETNEYFGVNGSPFTPVEESQIESNRPRHLPFHAVNKQPNSNNDINEDGIYTDDYTQATNSLLTFNLKQNNTNFTNQNQLDGVQSNFVPESDQNTGVQNMNPQQGPQGLNTPVGYNY